MLLSLPNDLHLFAFSFPYSFLIRVCLLFRTTTPERSRPLLDARSSFRCTWPTPNKEFVRFVRFASTFCLHFRFSVSISSACSSSSLARHLSVTLRFDPPLAVCALDQNQQNDSTNVCPRFFSIRPLARFRFSSARHR